MQIEFAIGEKVLLATKHLGLIGVCMFQQCYIGPLEVIESIETQAYHLKLPQVAARHHDVFNILLLQAYVARGQGIVIP